MYAEHFTLSGWEVGGLRFLGILPAGQTRNLLWADGTGVGLRLTTLVDGQNPATVRIVKPNGGVVGPFPAFPASPDNGDGGGSR